MRKGQGQRPLLDARGFQKEKKELYCQVCLHTQGICLGVRSFQYRKYKHSADNI